jgi:hypothetical protein
VPATPATIVTTGRIAASAPPPIATTLSVIATAATEAPRWYEASSPPAEMTATATPPTAPAATRAQRRSGPPNRPASQPIDSTPMAAPAVSVATTRLGRNSATCVEAIAPWSMVLNATPRSTASHTSASAATTEAPGTSLPELPVRSAGSLMPMKGIGACEDGFQEGVRHGRRIHRAGTTQRTGT